MINQLIIIVHFQLVKVIINDFNLVKVIIAILDKYHSLLHIIFYNYNSVFYSKFWFLLY